MGRGSGHGPATGARRHAEPDTDQDQAPDSLFTPQPLRDYALIADGERGAVVGPRGEFAWMCAPRWDSPAVFAGLIGGGGVYAVTPVGRFVWGGSYEPGTLIWRSRWATGAGIVECAEALALPADPRRATVLRRVRALDGPARVRVVLDPRADYGREAPWRPVRDASGIWTGRSGPLVLRWSGAADARPDPDATGRLLLELDLKPGQSHDLVLELAEGGEHGLPDRPPAPDRAWRETRDAWQAEVPALHGTLADRDATQSYAVLRGLTGSAGGMVAAATTSLPERAEAGRNYDYRYVWLRDQCYVGQAAAAAGGLPLLDDAVRFTAARLLQDGPDTSPAYTVDGGPIPDQGRLSLPGYPGGYDLIGNQVRHQFQLDVFGEALLLFARAAELDRLDDDGRRAALAAADAVARRYREPDSGVWELEPRAWTHSKLVCVAGLRAMAGVEPGAKAREWSALADAVLAEAERGGSHPDGRWQRSPEDPGLDAALLLPPLRGALPPDDPRTAATLRAFRRELTEERFAYRFRHDDRPLGDAEGAFVLCGFVVALAEHQQGRTEEARIWFERSRAACGPTGLFSEEYDVTQRQLRGNLPQAFVHGMLLESAARLARPWGTG